jgi:tRNA U38,U39,U40 pseudouridine synthase TruA
MVRNMVGALVAVGSETLSPDKVKEILQAKSNNLPNSHFNTAPSNGLFLMNVHYDPNGITAKERSLMNILNNSN